MFRELPRKAVNGLVTLLVLLLVLGIAVERTISAARAESPVGAVVGIVAIGLVGLGLG